MSLKKLNELRKLVEYDTLAVVVNNLLERIRGKANSKHKHPPVDIETTNEKQFVSKTEKEKIALIKSDGAGTSFLSDDGLYKEVKNDIIITTGDGTSLLSDDGTYKSIGDMASIDDEVSSIISTYSSDKIEKMMEDKANSDDLHSHSNKSILDQLTNEQVSKWHDKTNIISSDGDGKSFLSNDGTYKSIQGIDNPIDDEVEDSIDTTLSSSKINANISNAVSNLSNEVDQKLTKKVTAVTGMGLSKHNYDDIEKNKVALLKTNAGAQNFLAGDGLYYNIDNVAINDEDPTNTATYSGIHIEKRINDGVLSLILPTQNDAPTMWKRNFENVSAGDILEMQTSFNFNINSAIIQVYKFIAGQKNQNKIISNFNNIESEKYTFNPDNVVFSDENGGHVRIKDTYSIPINVNSDGFYESQVISKSDYVDFNDIIIATL